MASIRVLLRLVRSGVTRVPKPPAPPMAPHHGRAEKGRHWHLGEKLCFEAYGAIDYLDVNSFRGPRVPTPLHDASHTTFSSSLGNARALGSVYLARLLSSHCRVGRGEGSSASGSPPASPIKFGRWDQAQNEVTSIRRYF